jgi:hypothetical protein
MLSESQKRSEFHLCGAYIKSATQEHLDAIKIQTTNAGSFFCNLQFPKNKYSDMNYSNTGRFQSNVYNFEHTFIRHITRMKSKALFIQEPYKDFYPAWFSKQITEVDFAYAGYSLSLVDYFPGQYGSDLIKNSKYLLAGSENEYVGYQKNASHKSNVMLTGNPLMYNLRESLKFTNSQTNKSKVILWAPHWIQEWENSENGFARWDTALDLLNSFLSKNSDCSLIFRPHPILRIAIQEKIKVDKRKTNNEVLKTKESKKFQQTLSRVWWKADF